MSEKLPDDVIDFGKLRGYIWAWLARTVTHKEDFKGETNEQLIKVITSIDYYFDWFIDMINELEVEE